MAMHVFWTSVSLILLVYVGYPVLVWLAGALWRKDVRKEEIWPKVSILISAYNEETDIAATIENKLSLDYPVGHLETIVVSDASTDRSDIIVKGYEHKGVRLLVQEKRQGKTAALNRAAETTDGEILMFSDANSIYRHDAIKNIVRNFADPAVGYVTGRMVYLDQSGSLVGSGSSAYMTYENRLRELETSCSVARFLKT